MGDVEIFRAELTAASGSSGQAASELLNQSAALQTEDVGIQNPASRPMLRLEMHRRVSALRRSALARTEEGSGLAAATQRIADRFQDLDVELSGQESS
ncbi:hypothetical protein [Microbacterium sp. CIAB417]|uniref:hypothetical protein n=1 Tax=Microbacterium sp. CIAB417 TaxID=2860287 RepID=UPI001FAB97C7|nr:hypothetical protein [Microbacterium sp. CIAB417]